MKHPQATRRTRAIGVAATLLFCLASFHFSWVQPALEERRLNDARIAKLRLQLARLSWAEQETQTLSSSASGDPSDDHQAVLSLPSGNPNVILAEVQNQLRDLAIQGNARLRRIDAKILPQRPSLQRIDLNLSLEANIGDLRNILHQLQDFSPTLFTHFMKARTLHHDPLRDPQLEVSLILNAYATESSVRSSDAKN